MAHNALQQVIRLARFSVHDSSCHHVAAARGLLDHQGEEADLAGKLLPRVLALLNDAPRRYGRITSYNVCYTKLLRCTLHG